MEEESHLGMRAPPLDPDVAALALLRVSHMRILVSSGTRAGADPPPSGGEGGLAAAVARAHPALPPAGAHPRGGRGNVEWR